MSITLLPVICRLPVISIGEEFIYGHERLLKPYLDKGYFFFYPKTDYIINVLCYCGYLWLLFAQDMSFHLMNIMESEEESSLPIQQIIFSIHALSQKWEDNVSELQQMVASSSTLHSCCTFRGQNKMIDIHSHLLATPYSDCLGDEGTTVVSTSQLSPHIPVFSYSLSYQFYQ